MVGADSIASGVEQKFLKEWLAAKGTELKELRTTGGAKFDHILFAKCQMVQYTLFNNTKAALWTQLVELEARLKAASIGMAAHRDRPHVGMGPMSSDWSSFFMSLR